MHSPWLDIPLSDYEGHMALPHVAQSALLADLFGHALEQHRPCSAALLGCAGGNGLERVDPAVTPRVVAVDINPAYVEEARRRHARRLPGLELLCGDIASPAVAFEPVELAFAGLLFEYVDLAPALRRIAAQLTPAGRLVAVLQMPSRTIAEVTPSPYASLGALSACMRLVPPDDLRAAAVPCGLEAASRKEIQIAGGKTFCTQTFARVP